MSGITIHMLNPGKSVEVAEQWAADYTGLRTRRAYQLDAGGQGIARKRVGDFDGDGDVDDDDSTAYTEIINPRKHLAALELKLSRAIPAGSPPGLVSMNDESGDAPWWFAIRTGRLRIGWRNLMEAWMTQARYSVPRQSPDQEGWIFAMNGWPRWTTRWEHASSVTEDASPIYERWTDAIMPVFYPRDPSEGSQNLNLRIMMQLAMVLSERYRLPIIPKIAIRVRGNGQPDNIDRWTEHLDTIMGTPGARIEGLVLWSGHGSEYEATQTSTLMVDGGYADALNKRFGI